MCFDVVSEDRCILAIAAYVLGVLEKYECVDNLELQTYVKAAAMASVLNGVQAKIKEKVPSRKEAMFIHCFLHELNLTLLQSAKCMPECCTLFWRS